MPLFKVKTDSKCRITVLKDTGGTIYPIEYDGFKEFGTTCENGTKFFVDFSIASGYSIRVTVNGTIRDRPGGSYKPSRSMFIVTTDTEVVVSSFLERTLTLINGKNVYMKISRTASIAGASSGILYEGSGAQQGSYSGVCFDGDDLKVEIRIPSSYTPYAWFNSVSYYFSLSDGYNRINTTKTISSESLRLEAYAVTRSNISIIAGANSTVSVYRSSSPQAHAPEGTIVDGQSIYTGDILSVSYSVSSGFNVATHTLNNNTFNSGILHTVDSGVVIRVTAKPKTYLLRRSIGDKAALTVTRTSSPNGRGDLGVLPETVTYVYYGDRLEFLGGGMPGYGLDEMRVNGVLCAGNPHRYTVEGSMPIEISVTAKALGFVYIDSGSTIEKYKILIDSGSVMEQHRAMIDTGAEIIPY